MYINIIKLDDGKSGKKKSNNPIFYFLFHFPFEKGIEQSNRKIILKFPT